ncbi:MAG: hypothetical protein PWP28_23 [Oceanotoga sp.]|jgi:hypothetical protein|uniref:Uncharacterized protein n=1 Tax=Oceanotoga teriensis TaxID=515440 RepID=A0AA45C868_9BACT|nr:hypothetical protein [Oceanotoga sp.]MDN5341148.1 hypothetical protein [Oceanotoga sp.]PWJ95906.1 hypothetical protein C7380_10384 [Oceanotoga teriensis]
MRKLKDFNRKEIKRFNMRNNIIILRLTFYFLSKKMIEGDI